MNVRGEVKSAHTIFEPSWYVMSVPAAERRRRPTEPKVKIGLLYRVPKFGPVVQPAVHIPRPKRKFKVFTSIRNAMSWIGVVSVIAIISGFATS